MKFGFCKLVILMIEVIINILIYVRELSNILNYCFKNYIKIKLKSK